jgi:hypothetical protein
VDKADWSFWRVVLMAVSLRWQTKLESGPGASFDPGVPILQH